MKVLNRDQMKISNFIAPVVLIGLAVNPFTETVEFHQEFVFMLSHYALFIGGFLLAYKILKLPSYAILGGAFLAVFWHVPYFFALAGAFPVFRALNDTTLIIGGILAGGSLHALNNGIRLSLLIAWMGADSVLAIILLAGWPPYSNLVYPFSPFSEPQEFLTGLSMFFIMFVIFLVAIANFLRTTFKMM
ncbi:hypothetical protein IC006_2110 [Sulfuracidifex tepidarius]|uniref:DUF1404 domain-containing protein n=1 Tax=Sulfuracidifex tepidarius TaxID=1294262 RepID=A0A510DX24_9CREN|nr:DUF1404 domain-containing protein [Sulfuracidifex tepidarius]BBG24776.1 hypothetical protein IC006_2110 [Sulfuracidifex tepidarius]